MTKLPSAEPIYGEWFRMLDEEGASYAEVARWLKSQGVRFPARSAGGYEEPTVQSVARYTFNTILKGVRERNRRKSKRIGSGRYVSVKAEASELLQRPAPHLAFFEPDYYDRVVAKLRARNGKYRRSDDPARDPCRNRPRRRTRLPGGVTVCGICGRPFVWGGHGQTDHLMCNGAREHRCWNGVTFDGSVAARRIAETVHAEVEALEGFDVEFLEVVREEFLRRDAERLRQVDDLRGRVVAAAVGITNLMKFIRGGDDSPSVREELRALEQERDRAAAALEAAERQPAEVVQIPDAEQVKELGRQCLKDVDCATEEFARVMRRLVRRVGVFPVRLCDGGAITLRARLTIRLSELLPCPHARQALLRPLERRPVIDLFEHPQRAAFRERVAAARAAGVSERAAAAELGITVTAAQYAAALHRRMGELELTDPYVPVLRPPDDCTKLRRHCHPDYRFEPLAQPDG